MARYKFYIVLYCLSVTSVVLKIFKKIQQQLWIDLYDEDAENGDAAVVQYMCHFQQLLNTLLIVMIMVFVALADVMRSCRRHRWCHWKLWGTLLLDASRSFVFSFGSLRPPSATFGKLSTYHSPNITFNKISYRRDSARRRSLRRSRSSKVIDVGTNSTKARMRLPISE